MARRDHTQGFAFVLPHTIVNFNKDPHAATTTTEKSSFDSLYDILEYAMDLLDNSDHTDAEVIDALISDLEKFKKS